MLKNLFFLLWRIVLNYQSNRIVVGNRIHRVIIFLFFVTGSYTINLCAANFDGPMNFVTVSDKEHCPLLPYLIESIKKFNPNNIINIIVFDIGMDPDQIDYLESNLSVKVVPIKMVHPDLCKVTEVRPNGKKVRGSYAWKPVALYQALDYFDYFLYLDSGIEITGPSDDLFLIIMRDGYFLTVSDWSIARITTNYVREKFALDDDLRKWILQAQPLWAGFQGISRRVFDSYVEPMYTFADDLRYFIDDRTTPIPGEGRHDQTLFSIMARFNGYKIHGDSLFLATDNTHFNISNYVKWCSRDKRWIVYNMQYGKK